MNILKANYGADFIELGVWDFNKNAKEFYEHLGMNVRMDRMEYKL
jgi:ribosomal protein S18 acetylase RimI-like enzyme